MVNGEAGRLDPPSTLEASMKPTNLSRSFDAGRQVRQGINGKRDQRDNNQKEDDVIKCTAWRRIRSLDARLIGAGPRSDLPTRARRGFSVALIRGMSRMEERQAMRQGRLRCRKSEKPAQGLPSWPTCTASSNDRSIAGKRRRADMMASATTAAALRTGTGSRSLQRVATDPGGAGLASADVGALSKKRRRAP